MHYIDLVMFGWVRYIVFSWVWTTGGGLRDANYCKSYSTQKISENPKKTKKTPRKIKKTFQKNKKTAWNNKKTPKNQKNWWNICFSTFGGQYLGGVKKCSGGGALFWSTGRSVIASYSTKITMVRYDIKQVYESLFVVQSSR